MKNLMNHLVLFVSILFVFLASYSNFNNPSSITAQIDYTKMNPTLSSEYDNPTKLLNFKFPSYWKNLEIPNSNMVILASPIKNVGIILETRDLSNSTVDEVVMKSIAQVKQNLVNAKIINNTISTSGGTFAAQEIIYTYGTNSSNYKVYQVLLFEGNTIYIFIYFSDTDLFDSFLNLAQAVRDSLTIPYENKNISNDRIANSIFTYNGFAQAKPKNENITRLNNPQLPSDLRPEHIVYNNTIQGIKLQYPSSMIKIENQLGLSLTTTNNSNGIIIVKAPLKNISQEDFAIKHLSSLNQTLDNFNIINSSTTNLLGYPTQMILFNYNNGSEVYQAMQFWKINYENSYIVTYFGESVKMFDNFLPTAIRIIESLILDVSG